MSSGFTGSGSNPNIYNYGGNQRTNEFIPCGPGSSFSCSWSGTGGSASVGGASGSVGSIGDSGNTGSLYSSQLPEPSGPVVRSLPPVPLEAKIVEGLSLYSGDTFSTNFITPTNGRTKAEGGDVDWSNDTSVPSENNEVYITLGANETSYKIVQQALNAQLPEGAVLDGIEVSYEYKVLEGEIVNETVGTISCEYTTPVAFPDFMVMGYNGTNTTYVIASNPDGPYDGTAYVSTSIPKPPGPSGGGG